MDVMQVLGAHGIGTGAPAGAETANEIARSYSVASSSSALAAGSLVELANTNQVRDAVITGDGVITGATNLVGTIAASSARESQQIKVKEISPGLFLMAWYDSGGSNCTKVAVVQELNGAFTVGTPIAITDATGNSRFALAVVSPTQAVILYGVGSPNVKAQELVINGFNITLGKSSTSTSGVDQNSVLDMVYMGNNFFVWTAMGGTYSYGKIATMTMTDTGFTFGLQAAFQGDLSYFQQLYRVGANELALIYDYFVNAVGYYQVIRIYEVDTLAQTLAQKTALTMNSAAGAARGMDLVQIDSYTLLVGYCNPQPTLRIITLTRDSNGKVNGISQGNPVVLDTGSDDIRIIPYSNSRFDILYATGTAIKSRGTSIGPGGAVTTDPVITLSSSATSTVEGLRTNSGTVVIFGDSTDSLKIKGLVKRITNVIGVAMNAATPGQMVKVLLKGIAKGFSSLTPNATYYVDSSGNLTKTGTATKLGVAISATELLIKKAFWER
ncbi:hypothetical protein [Brevibacillus sp. SAFN-007a]|uniref:hypothetical protein n=1 Tax=Brevibacillus sp. SAFN-007a TaxID=3436862 RepID=UPI003F7EB116